MNKLAKLWLDKICLLFPIAVSFISCYPNASLPLFSKLSPSETGVTFANTLPEQTAEGMNIVQYLYYYNGGGVATGDLNNDGLPDLFFTSNLEKNRFYLNKGNFKFEDATEKAGVAGTGSWKTGVSLADVNADGWLDIYVCQVGNYKTFKGKNQLFINNRDGTFSDKAAEYGLDLAAFCTQAAFFDYDLDGDLDCFVLCHSVHSPESYKDTSVSRQFDPLASDRLFKNQGGKFVDVTASSGLRDGKSGYGLGLAIGDLNADGYPDIYVANDFHENDFLYYNIQGQYFRESIAQSTGHTSNFSMGCDIADFNNDCRPDIVTLDMKPEDEPTLKASQPADPYQVYEYKHSFGYHWQFPRNNLQLNQAPLSMRRGVGGEASPPLLGGARRGFSEIGQLAGIATTDWSWSALFADFDLDGWKDLFITNSIPRRPNDMDYLKFISTAAAQRNATDLEFIQKMPSGAAENYCFRNNSDLTFENVSEKWGLAHKGFSNGAAYADLDLDGDLDLVTNDLNTPASIFRNNANGANFLKIKLIGEGGNTFGIGASVNFFTGDRVQYFENQPVRGFQSCVEPGLLTVGLGKNAAADSLIVIWPGGFQEVLRSVPANQTITLKKENGRLAKPRNDSQSLLVHSWIELPNVYFNADIQDLTREKLLPWSLDSRNPKFYVADLNGDGLDDFYTLDTAFIQQPNGSFSLAPPPVFPRKFISENTSCIRAADFDGDGDEDLFVGAHFADDAYGLSPKSYLLQNDGNGNFTDITPSFMGRLGGVSDAQWVDFEKDNRPDLVVVGEWTPITIFKNTASGFEKMEIPNSAGLWNCVAAADFDGDGDTDLVAGNLGLNSNLHASPIEPLGLWVKDFDSNGSTDPILTYYRQGKNYIFADKDLLVSQLPGLKKQFVEYRKYAESTFEEVFPKEMREGAIHRKAEVLASCWVENKGGGQWALHPLPNEAQFSPVFAVLPHDFNGDGHLDVLLGGNFYEIQPSIGRFDASFGTLLAGDGKGDFKTVPPSESGFWLPGAVRDLKIINGFNGKKSLLIGVNGGRARLLHFGSDVK